MIYFDRDPDEKIDRAIAYDNWLIEEGKREHAAKRERDLKIKRDRRARKFIQKHGVTQEEYDANVARDEYEAMQLFQG